MTPGNGGIPSKPYTINMGIFPNNISASSTIFFSWLVAKVLDLPDRCCVIQKCILKEEQWLHNIELDKLYVSMTVNVNKGKIKLPLFLMKTYSVLNWTLCHGHICGSGGITTNILNLNNWWRFVVSFTDPDILLPKERAPGTYLIGDWVGPQSRSGHGGEEKKISAPAGNRTPEPRSSNP